MTSTAETLRTKNLAVGYQQGKAKAPTLILEGLSLELPPGRLTCLLGPNGAGKSTLMRTLAGLQAPLSGSVMLGDTNILHEEPAYIARKMSMVLTDRIEASNMTGMELVALGRTPYTNWLGILTPTDKEMIDWALDVSGARPLAQRRIHQLSDGERQKILIARALAQDTDVIILDEPTAHLDLPNRLEMMQLLHELARKTQKAILISTHELDLALRMADNLWLIGPQNHFHVGLPEELVLNGAFEAAFSRSGLCFDNQTGNFLIGTSSLTHRVTASGTLLGLAWTERALRKQGIELSTVPANGQITILADDQNNWRWRWQEAEDSTVFHSLGALIDRLKIYLARQD
ncbi:ABC transporter ATP-binding protein [Dyadobacter tibetensis]|uniref:ABC transporter ATP-binding protein n=1 Tax=Dyadobacter tibetensis TaxID=1211851 RepID=UPI00046F1C81|nr:ABC transporter ATP-binding protein [Dyadobacter tibetensis]